MRTYIPSLLALLLAHQILAATSLRFLPMNRNALALVLPKDMYGNTDADFSKLYSLLNVPEQDGPLGKGKALKTDDKSFNLACSLSKSQCQVVLNNSPQVNLDPQRKYMSFRATGAQAEQLSSAFFVNADKEIYYITADRMFRIYGNASVFVFEASADGFSE